MKQNAGFQLNTRACGDVDHMEIGHDALSELALCKLSTDTDDAYG